MNALLEFIPSVSPAIKFQKFDTKNYLLIHEEHQHYIKLSTSTFDLIRCIDGTKTIEEITLAYNQNYKKELSPELVYKVLVQDLGVYGLLENESVTIRKKEKPNYLKLSFIFFPQSFLERIVPSFFFCFKTSSVILSGVIALILLALNFLNFNTSQFFIGAKDVPLFIIIFVISSLAHELGHASSCNYFGAKHGGIGAGFYIFSPVLFADVSSIWQLSKMKRIGVNLSGVYFELLIFICFSSIGFLIHQPMVNQISTLIFIKTLWNLNPFIRNDGYWVLSDLSNTPNLVHHSLKKMNELYYALKNKISLNWSKTDVFLLLYAFVNYTFMLYFIYYMLILNTKSVLYFPMNCYYMVQKIIAGIPISYSEIAPLILGLSFYYLLVLFLKFAFKNFYALSK